jgi:uncharacterized membrane protein YdjX (TVP38/TMEM64 family)
MDAAGPRSAGRLRRWLPVAALLCLIAAAYVFGLHEYLSLSAIALNREALKAYVAANLPLAALLYMAAYVAVVALSIPVAAAMSIAGGFLFGWMLSVPMTVVAAVAGAAIVFQIVKTSLGEALAARTEGLVARLSKGFAENAFGLLLFLRLAPVFPFYAVNAVAGLCRVPLRTFILATAIGIIPASIAFALVGSGLDAVIDQQMAAYQACVATQGEASCRLTISPRDLLSRELVWGFAALGLVALLPLGFRLIKARPV